MLGRLKHLIELHQVFTNLQDIMTFRALRDRRFTGDLADLGLREIGHHRLLVRPKTTDLKVLIATFVDQHHLPQVRIPDDATIVDLGAYTGFTPCHFAYRYPTARVLAVEMDRENYDLAVRNTAAFAPRCQVINAAIWTEDGTVAYAGKNAWGYHVTGPSPGRSRTGHSVPALSMATLLAEHGIDRVDYLKMDIEGAEAAVLATGTSWIDRVAAINLECHPVRDQRSTVASCRDILKTFGFVCRPVASNRLALSAIHPQRTEWLDAPTFA